MKPAASLLIALSVFASSAVGDEVQIPIKTQAKKRFRALSEYCKNRQFTHIVELSVEWKEFFTEEHRSEVMGAITEIWKDATELEKGNGQIKFFPELPFAKVFLTKQENTPEGSTHLHEDYEFVNPTRSFLHAEYFCTSKSFRRNYTSLKKSVIISNAATAKFDAVDGSILITSGDVDFGTRCSENILISSGSVYTDKPLSSVIIAGGKILTADRKKDLDPDSHPSSKLLANDKKLLGVKFYTCAEDGLEATLEKAGITVKTVKEKKPFAEADVRVGDLIEKINGETVPSLHELNRMLCRATVASGTARMRLRRNGEVVIAEVKLKEW